MQDQYEFDIVIDEDALDDLFALLPDRPEWIDSDVLKELYTALEGLSLDIPEEQLMIYEEEI